jgi:hydroxyacylglutathione hydrolase
MTIQYLPGKGYDSNVYVITGSDPILVDTGTGRHSQALLGKIAPLVDLNMLKKIILTHRHYDHVGGAAFLSGKLKAEIFIHQEDAQAVTQADGRGTMADAFGEELEPFEVSPLKGGEVISTGEHDLKVIHTPGHSAGSICLLDERDKALISGDTVFVGGVGRWDLPSGDYATLVRSVKTLYGLAPASIYPGHGPCGVGNGKEQIAEALSYLGES